MFPAARIGDPITHDMLVPSGVIGPQAPAPCPMCGSAPVIIEMLPAAHVSCCCICSGATSGGPIHPPIPGPQPPIVKGSLSVLIHNMPAARWSPSMDVGGCGVFLGDPKLAATRTVLIGDVGMGGVPPVAGGGGSLSHEACFQCRRDLIERGLAHPDPNVVAAAEALDRLQVDYEYLKLSDDVYGDTDRGTPPGWTNISDDAEALSKYGLTPEMLENPENSEYRSQMYVPDPEVFGDAVKPTVAFKGTSMTSTEDWKNNFAQGLGLQSDYYENAVGIGNAIGDTGNASGVHMTGHSLGGGMASAASSASGSDGTTFNSAGLNTSTVEKYGGQDHPTDINAYRVENELLTGIQEQGPKGTLAAASVGQVLGGPTGAALGGLGKILVSAIAPDAVGDKYDIPGTSLDPVNRHLRPDIYYGMEQKLNEAQTILEEATGSHCDC
jgi:hypothetical protein